MFKKLKDKLAEEVKSSPNRIQQFAQAAQAAVTSASSSISDITNNDLFSIGGENDVQQNQSIKQNVDTQGKECNQGRQAAIQTASDLVDFQTPGAHRQRRLSNSSFASDVSFKLPSYESPSMYHLQSDIDVSASEAEDRLVSPGGVSLERVSKEQLYAAYRRTQERYSKYRTQYADLARHYKILERENAKARSVLVETQDKALRRISELREQCTLEQSAKAHLERALRVDIDEKNIEIETLKTKINLIQSCTDSSQSSTQLNKTEEKEAHLVDITTVSNNTQNATSAENETIDVAQLRNKIDKMEQLINKYKDSLKNTKDKNNQINMELKTLTSEVENKSQENEKLKSLVTKLTEANNAMQQLQETNEDLQNKLNTYDFNKTKEFKALESDLFKERDINASLRKKIEVFSKKEEEYAISLAENKLSIHKELESKESEIKSLKNSLSISKKEIESLGIIANDYKKKVSALEEECSKLNGKNNELSRENNLISEKESQILELRQKCVNLEQNIMKSDEEYKCLQLQAKQESAEKLAMVDRNTYLEERIKQINEDNSKKADQLSVLENKLKKIIDENKTGAQEISDANAWKEKYHILETEIQEERVELVKLQSEIEKLLKNHDFVQLENVKLINQVGELKTLINKLQEKDIMKSNNCKILLNEMKAQLIELRNIKADLHNQINSYKIDTQQYQLQINRVLGELFKNLKHEAEINSIEDHNSNNTKILENAITQLKIDNAALHEDNEILKTKNGYLLEESHAKDNLLLEVSTLNDEKLNLISKLKNIESSLNDSEIRNKESLKEINDLTSANNDLNMMYTKVSLSYEQLQKTYETMQQELQSAIEKCHELTKKVNQLDEEKRGLSLKIEDTETISSTMSVLIEENNKLKNNIELFENNETKLHKDLSDMKISNSEVQKENNRLNSVIKELEEIQKKNKTSNANAECQTIGLDKNLQNIIESIQDENNILKNKCEQTKQEKETLHEKLILLDQKCIELQTEIEAKQKTINDSEIKSQFNLSEKQNECNMLQTELQQVKEENLKLVVEVSKVKSHSDANGESNEIAIETLKEENRRLQSDVEGLQAYLTKISKENSVLNDKIREMIASSENSDVTENQIELLLQNVKTLEQDLEKEKDKSDEILRHNSLLVEENLELKDQLQSHNNVNKLQIDYNGDKKQTHNNYEELVKAKTELDKKVSLLESQNSLSNNNIVQLQGTNQKLRLSNEKLERRLDEALVSLRHLHSLQENTELEYLKNILYEYLTGSGTHSITLAKVLAAVVKFDDKQTNAVIQKEKERQGLLHQLGLL